MWLTDKLLMWIRYTEHKWNIRDSIKYTLPLFFETIIQVNSECFPSNSKFNSGFYFLSKNCGWMKILKFSIAIRTTTTRVRIVSENWSVFGEIIVLVAVVKSKFLWTYIIFLMMHMCMHAVYFKICLKEITWNSARDLWAI